MVKIGPDMEEKIVDTNVILRFLVKDDEGLYQKAVKIFQKAEAGKYRLVVKSIVVAEAAFVLESFYKKDRRSIAGVFKVFLSQKWLKVEDRKVLLSLWNNYEKGKHFVDCFLLACCRTDRIELITFDKQLKKQEQL